MQSQDCYAEDWNRILVKDGFVSDNIAHVRFFGDIRLGSFQSSLTCSDGIVRRSGIRYAELHGVTVGDHCLIEHVHGYIARYHIGDDVYISNVGIMTVDGQTSFGTGTKVHVLSEAGDRFLVPLHRKLSAQEFYLRTTLNEEERLHLDNWVEEKRINELRMEGFVEKHAQILQTRFIKNAYVGESARIEGADCLEEISLYSTSEAPVSIGFGVICRHTLVLEGAEILDGAKVNECFVGQAVHLGKGFSAESSLFFANSYMDNGESCSICAGPYTVSHHKSTLLIGGMFSFMNAGSGTNMSNHMYKLGPLHYGIMDRGCKTASGAHLVWDGHIGAFSMVMGKYDTHTDLSEFPFSYLFNTNGRIHLVPGVNFATAGTYRDIHKWPSRDKRADTLVIQDYISTYEALNPYIIGQMVKGRKHLQQMLEEQGANSEEYRLDGKIYLSSKALKRGIELYQWIEELYVARSVDNSESADMEIDATEWCDALGLLLPAVSFSSMRADVIRGNVHSLEEISQQFASFWHNYAHLQVCYVKQAYSHPFIRKALEHYEENLNQYYDRLFEDVKKELQLGGEAVRAASDDFVARLQNDRLEQLKKAKEKISSLLGDYE